MIGENETVCREAWDEDHLGDRDSLDLPGRQEELARRLIETGVPLVGAADQRPPALGQLLSPKRPMRSSKAGTWARRAAAAFADALFGEVNPGGRLPISFPRSVGQLPAYYNHKPSARRSYLWADKTPLFPFGHGLSYTSFEYRDLQVSPAQIQPDGHAMVRVEVVNTGTRPGDEVVQLYIHDVLTERVTRPVKELKAFRRISAPARRAAGC